MPPAFVLSQDQTLKFDLDYLKTLLSSHTCVKFDVFKSIIVVYFSFYTSLLISLYLVVNVLALALGECLIILP